MNGELPSNTEIDPERAAIISNNFIFNSNQQIS
jgi:hypothetical protein